MPSKRCNNNKNRSNDKKKNNKNFNNMRRRSSSISVNTTTTTNINNYNCNSNNNKNKNLNLKNLGTRPALTMSVPVRYTAAANYAVASASAAAATAAVVVDSSRRPSGLIYNSLQQEEQYHLQQQQQQLQHQLQQQQQQYQQHQQQEFDNDFFIYHQQQQLMQQRSSMSASSSSSSSSGVNNNNINMMEQASTSAAAAAAAAAAAKHAATPSRASFAAVAAAAAAAAAVGTQSIADGGNGHGHGRRDHDHDDDGNAEMRTDWMRMSDEGRYGTPGAASLEYQKFEQQQHKTPANNNNNNSNNGDQPMEPSSPLGDTENNNNNNTNNKDLEDELCAMSSEELYNTLKEYDALQDKYHTVLLMPKESKREVTAGGRDGSAYVLRCLKMWYELPSDVLFNAMSLVDRFLDRMAVKPKHMACMSVASFYLAIKQLDLKTIPADDLVTISQCGCTAGDLERMSNVIVDKLGVQMGHAPVTSVNFLRVYYALFYNLAKEIGGPFFEFYKQFIKLKELENRLENLLCDVKTTVITPSTLALVLVCLHLDFHIKESYTKGRPELKTVFEYILFLQQFMRIPDRVFTCGFSVVSGILSSYNNQTKQPYKQRLVWKLSSRTLRVLRPINRFSSDLPTIEEGISNAMDDGCRSRTESLSSEEEEDWPTSPIIPIFEQC